MARKPATMPSDKLSPSDQLSPPDQRGDQRAGQRFTLVLRAGKLRTTAGEFLCVLRDVSDRGVKVRLFHQLTLGEICELELSGGETFRVIVIWQRRDHAGFRFADGPVAVDRLIEEAGSFPKRSIRLKLNRPVPILLAVDGLTLPAQLCDISQHGAALALDQRLAIGCQVRIEGEQMPVLHARVRWRRGSLHGLVFQEGFRLDALAQLAVHIQLDPHDAQNHPQPIKIGAALTTG